MIETVDIVGATVAAGRSAWNGVRGVSAHSEMAGPNASAEGVRETNPRHHRIAPEVSLFSLSSYKNKI